MATHLKNLRLKVASFDEARLILHHCRSMESLKVESAVDVGPRFEDHPLPRVDNANLRSVHLGFNVFMLMQSKSRVWHGLGGIMRTLNTCSRLTDLAFDLEQLPWVQFHRICLF